MAAGTVRPEFSVAMSYDVFCSFYWYKSELQDICREHGLPTYGTKAEFTQYVADFLNGKAPAEI